MREFYQSEKITQFIKAEYDDEPEFLFDSDDVAVFRKGERKKCML